MQLLHWQGSTALTLSFAMMTSLVAPLNWADSVSAHELYRTAQLLPPSLRNDRPDRSGSGNYGSYRGIRAGTIIPTRYDKDSIVVTPTETADLTLIVDADIRAGSGAVLIPAGSQIKGALRPTSDGTQFVASELILENGDRFPIDARSDVISRRETISKRSDPRIFEGVAIGAVAASILGEIFGQVELWQVLGGAGVGALGSLLIRNRQTVEVITINPATDLDLQLESDFTRSS
jgi:hypothetical protein